jgi:hypothetical protein
MSGDVIINMNKDAETLVCGDLKPKDAEQPADVKPKLDDSTSDVPAKAEDVSKDEEKTAEALSADDKAPVPVTVEATPKTEDALNPTDSTETAEEMAKDVENKTDDYVTEGGDAKADDVSSAIVTRRESQAPMNKDSARKSILKKAAVNPALLGALIGGAGGAAHGLMGPEDEEESNANRLRRMLRHSLIGAGIGGGGTMLAQHLGTKLEPERPSPLNKAVGKLKDLEYLGRGVLGDEQYSWVHDDALSSTLGTELSPQEGRRALRKHRV